MNIVTGHKRMALALLLSLSYLLVFMQRTGPGVISDQLQHEFHVTSAVLGMMASVQYFLYMFLQVPVGLSGDKYGPHRLFVTGVCLDGVGTLVFATSHSFVLLLIGRAIVGFGDSLIWVNIVLLIGRKFAATDFGKLLGFVTTAGNLGALLTTVPFALWIANVGWRTPFLLLGILLVMISLLNYAALRESEPQVRTKAANPATDASRLNTGMTAIQLLKDVVHDRISLATFFTHFGAVGTYIGFMGLWAVPYFMDTYSLSRAGATVLTMTAFFGAIVGGPLAGWWSDRIGQRRGPYLVFQSLSTVAWLMVPICLGKPPIVVAYLCMFVLGMGSGASLLTFAVIRAEIPSYRIGATSGFANTGGFLSAVLLPIFFGLIIDVSGGKGEFVPGAHSFALAFLVPALFSFFGVLGCLAIRENRADSRQVTIPILE